MAALDNAANDGSSALEAGSIRAQLERILHSQTFAQAPVLRRLLQYIVESTIGGRERDLKEYAVGVDVFGRGPDFDPRTDTIVRVQARRLRARLDDYYRREGVGDPIIVDVPRGRYVAECQRASTPVATDIVRSAIPSTSALDPVETVSSIGPASIVVLPFLNLSGDPENDYFTDGLTDEITSTLACVPALRVVARTSAFQYKGRSDDIRKIGRDLGVRAALEGSVRRDGQRVRVTAQLIDATDGFHLWSHIYDGELPGVFGLQAQTTRSIVSALRIRLLPREQERLRPLEPASTEVYELYLKGLAHFHKVTPGDLEASIRYMERAVALDANYAAAHAIMAEAYILWSTLGDQPASRLVASARRAAQRALELDDLAEAHAAMGSVLAMDWAWNDAEREYRRALALKPSYVYPRLTYATACLCPLRRYDEAIDQVRVARTIDPASAFVRTILGQTLVLAGRSAEAVDELRRTMELAPDFVFARYTLGLAYLMTQSYADALTTLQPIAHLAAQIPNCAGHLAHTHACMGNRAEAQRLLDLLLERFQGAWAPWIDIAAIYNGLGETTQAIEWLERGYQQRCFDSLFIRDDPRFVNLRSNLRFRRLLEKVGIVPDA